MGLQGWLLQTLAAADVTGGTLQHLPGFPYRSPQKLRLPAGLTAPPCLQLPLRRWRGMERSWMCCGRASRARSARPRRARRQPLRFRQHTPDAPAVCAPPACHSLPPFHFRFRPPHKWVRWLWFVVSAAIYHPGRLTSQACFSCCSLLLVFMLRLLALFLKGNRPPLSLRPHALVSLHSASFVCCPSFVAPESPALLPAFSSSTLPEHRC